MALDAGYYVTDLVKVGILALVGSRVVKSIGEKDISEIIWGVGVTSVGLDIMGIVTPMINSIVKFINAFNAGAAKIEGIYNAIDKSGILNKIMSFGGKLGK